MLQFGVWAAWCKCQWGSCLFTLPDATKRNLQSKVSLQFNLTQTEKKWLSTASYFLKSRMAMTMMMMRTTANTGPMTHNISGCSIPWAILVVTWIGSEYGLAENVICKGKEKRENAGVIWKVIWIFFIFFSCLFYWFLQSLLVKGKNYRRLLL